MAQGLMFFIPVFIIIAASKIFKMDTTIALVIMLSLLYMQVTKVDAQNNILQYIFNSIFGANSGIAKALGDFGYSGGMLPPIFIAFFGGYVDRYFRKKLPGVIRLFLAPALTVSIMVIATVFVIGPVFGAVGKGLSLAMFSLQDIPVVGYALMGLILGFFWQILVIFGIHGLIMFPIMDSITTQPDKPLFIMGPLMIAVLAQCAAALAISTKIKNKERRSAATSAFVSALFGVTEPTIYGFTLPKKYPFFIAAGFAGAAGAILGIINAIVPGLAEGTMAGQGLFFLIGYLGNTVGGNLVAFGLVTLVTAAMFAGIVLVIRLVYKPDKEDLEDIVEKPIVIPASFDKASAIKVVSPLEGRAISLASAKDAAFKEGSLGKGLALLPEKFSKILAPISGTLVNIAPTGHAFGILSDEGVEVLVHIGIDTVNLKGRGFEIKAAQGAKVKAGDWIIQVDKDIIARAGYSNETYVVISNSDEYEEIYPETGKKLAGDVLIYLGKKAAVAAEPVAETVEVA
jgi:PTS system beta-glucosides-specific IIC component